MSNSSAHAHSFGQEDKRPGESRTVVVIAITGTMMVVEIVTGVLFGSMALLADGLHMASHAVALGVSACAYVYARRHAHNPVYSFGTGKVNALGGFTGAVLLAVFALIMAWESIFRFLQPVQIAFDQAILVAIVGLIVNGVSVLILNHRDQHHHGPEHSEDGSHRPGQHHDHNLRAAYLHVMADALTSLLAIFALLAGKYLDLIWMDPLMGIIGAFLVSRWSLGLLRMTGAVLLDRQGPPDLIETMRSNIEKHQDNRVVDIHLWAIGPNVYSLILSIVTAKPRALEHYRQMIPSDAGVEHITIEIRPPADEDIVRQEGA